MARIGVRVLRQDASAILRRVAAGERVEITDRGRPVALLVPISRGDALTKLAAEGRLTRARGDLLGLGPPLRVPAGKASASRRLARARARER
jgi:prevent-host-death family protein